MVKIQNLVDKPVNQGNGQVKGEIEQKLSPNTLPETCPPSKKFALVSTKVKVFLIFFAPEQDRQSTAADLPHDAILCQVVWTALLLLLSQGELSRQSGCEACQTVQGLTPVGTMLQNCGITSLVIEFSAFATLVCIKHATHPELWDWGTGSYLDLRFGLAITFFSENVYDFYQGRLLF